MALTRIGSVGLSTGININAGVGTFTGDLTVGGVLTYEDVTNVDSIGIITARNGIIVGSGITLSKDGDIFATGVTTATKFVGDGSELTGVASTENIRTNTNATFLQNVNVSGTATVGGDVNIADKIVHIGDTDTAIRFPAADTFSVETAGNEAARINSSQKVLIGSTAIRNVGGAAASGHIQLEGLTANTSSVSLINNQNDTNSPVLRFGKTRGASDGAVTTVADGDDLGQIQFVGADGTDLENATANIKAIVNGTVAGNQIPTDLVFETSATNGNSKAERLRIASDGKIGIGTAGPTALLHLAAGGGGNVIELQRNGTNTTGNIGAINFTAFDGHSVANMGAYGDGDNEGAYINFKTTSAASANSPFTSTTERLRIGSAGQIGIAGANYGSDNQVLTSQGSSSPVEWRGVNTPAWFGRQDTAHNIGNTSWTTILNLGNSVVNPSANNGGWNESTGIFTVQSGQAGTYYVYGQAAIDDLQDQDVIRAGFSKNDGTVPLYSQQRCIDQGSNIIVNSGLIAQTVELAVGDTIKLQVYHNEGNSQATEAIYCFFGGYRLSV